MLDSSYAITGRGRWLAALAVVSAGLAATGAAVPAPEPAAGGPGGAERCGEGEPLRAGDAPPSGCADSYADALDPPA